jgi:hypothetical protein
MFRARRNYQAGDINGCGMASRSGRDSVRDAVRSSPGEPCEDGTSFGP